MDRGVKIILAAGVLMGGIAVALLFRHPQPRDSPRSPGSYEPMVLRQWIGAEVAGHPGGGRPTVRIKPSHRPAERPATPDRTPTVLTPIDPGEPPPPLASSYPHSRPVATSRWGRSMALGLLEEARSEWLPRTHKIVDGDTLPALAERYLGSADRYMEIFEANRYALPGPEVLPIGVELTIPARRKEAASPPDATLHPPLVPIPRDSGRRGRPPAAD